MDQIDRRMLELLQQNARITISELSKELSLSRPSVTERFQRLQERGVIVGFTAIVPPHVVGKKVSFIIQISDLKVSASEFESRISKEEDIIECHRVTGPISYYLKAAVADMNSLSVLVDRLLAFGNLNTSVILASPISPRPILPILE
jgi:Transcriptional regulators